MFRNGIVFWFRKDSLQTNRKDWRIFAMLSVLENIATSRRTSRNLSVLFCSPLTCWNIERISRTLKRLEGSSKVEGSSNDMYGTSNDIRLWMFFKVLSNFQKCSCFFNSEEISQIWFESWRYFRSSTIVQKELEGLWIWIQRSVVVPGSRTD